MTTRPILLIGGYGKVGRATARILRDSHPDAPLLIGGRDGARAAAAAEAIGHAKGVALDLRQPDLGLGEQEVGAVAIFFKDDTLAALRFAQSRGAPHVSISSSAHEIGPEVAAYMQRPALAPVVLGAEWLVGATMMPALRMARSLGRVDAVRVGALLDEQDTTGPAGDIDMERLIRAMPAALTRRQGAWIWREGEQAKASFRALDGTVVPASALAPYDVLGLAAATDAPDVSFDLAAGVLSSTRRRGEPMSTEILIEMDGVDADGKSVRLRHGVFHPQGQMPLTGLGVALVLERLVGLDGRPAAAPGLYFPYQLLDDDTYFARFASIGGQVLTLDA